MSSYLDVFIHSAVIIFFLEPFPYAWKIAHVVSPCNGRRAVVPLNRHVASRGSCSVVSIEPLIPAQIGRFDQDLMFKEVSFQDLALSNFYIDRGV